MSKALKPIIITVAVILVLAIAMILLIFVFPEKGSEETPEPTASAAPATSVKIIDEDDSQLVSFQFLPAEGESMLVEIHRDADGNLSYTVTPATQYFEYDTSKFRSMIFTLTSMTATNLVEENAADLSVYGLDHPWHTVRSTYADGRVIDLYIGNATPTDNNYYCMTNAGNTVYTIGSYVTGLLARTDIDYRDITLFPSYADDAIYENICYVKMTLRDGTEIEISLEDFENFSEYNYVNSEYYMTLPLESSCNDTLVQSRVLDVVALIENLGVYKDITPEEYADYGLDHPARLELADVEGNTMDILVGGTNEDGNYYCMLSVSPETVIICTYTAFDWLNLNYIELMNRIVWHKNITEVDSVEYDLNGETYVVDYTHGVTTSEDGKTTNTLSATLNGEPISETNGRRLFVRTLNFRIVGDVPEGTPIGEPSYAVTMHCLDGTDRVMELIKINERQYAVRMDGEVRFYVYKKNVTTLEDAFATVLSGRELPMSFDN